MKFTIITAALTGYTSARSRSSHQQLHSQVQLAQVGRDEYDTIRNNYKTWLNANKSNTQESPEPEVEEEKEESNDPQGKYKTCDGSIKRLMDQKNAPQQASGTAKFVDDSFEGASSLYWSGKERCKNSEASFKGMSLEFKRPENMSTKTSLFGDSNTPGPNDIKQGQIGDCWFLGGLSSVAEYPDRITSAIDDSKWQSNGLLNVGFWSMGEKINVSVDSRLPSYKSGGQYKPNFANQSKNTNAWWVSMMEKAAAKFFGRYEALVSGNGFESFYMLTGMPSIQQNTATDTYAQSWKLYQAIKKADNKHYTMTASCHNSNSLGLYAGHLYTLLGVAKVGDTQLIKIRNPHASEKYTGPWNDNSQQMKDAAEQLGHSLTKNDGIFYMPVGKFKSAFQTFTINYYSEDWKISSKKVESSSPSVTVTNPQKQNVILGMVGRNPRHIMNTSCTTDQRLANFGFFVKSGSTTLKSGTDKATSMITSTGQFYSQTNAGQSWIQFDNLEQGTYKLSTLKFSNVSYSGNYTVMMQAFADKEPVTFA